MMNEIEQLQNTLKWRRARKSPGAVSLGQVAQQLLDEEISPRQDRFSQVNEVWSQLLPAELGQHCEIFGISGGQLEVRVDSPSIATTRSPS